MNMALKIRMDRHIAKSEDGCWEWTGSRLPRGYGHLSVAGKSQRAHRVYWELCRGPIPERMNVLHKCDNPPCVNPDHLFLGTMAENNADMWAKNRAVVPRGSQQGSSVLSEADVLRIFADPRAHKAIAASFGIERTTVNNIKTGKTWRWLTKDQIRGGKKIAVRGKSPSKAQIERILSRGAAGERHASIADDYGLTRRAISRIIKVSSEVASPLFPPDKEPPR